MRIAVMGAGAVGGYFGGILSREGNEVTLVARGAHLEAIRNRGLEVKTRTGDFSATVDATDDPRRVGPVELVVLSVKTYQTAEAILSLMSLVGEDTSLITIQNGVETYEELAAAMGRERVLPGATYISAQLESPGTVRLSGDPGRIVFGEIDGRETPRAQHILDTFRAAHIPTELSADVVKDLWTKFLFVSVIGGVTSAARASVSQVLQHQEAREMVVAAMTEVEAVGRARGVALDPDVVAKTMNYVESNAIHLHASMHTDLVLGRPLELEALNGATVRIGRQLGVPTPVNSVLYSTLVVHKDGAVAGTGTVSG